nr:15645_t:CDS:2 [Entrophospora candida]
MTPEERARKRAMEGVVRSLRASIQSLLKCILDKFITAKSINFQESIPVILEFYSIIS